MRDLMLRAIRISRPTLRLLGRDQRGSIGVLVAVLIAGGALFGIGALAIDVGQLYQERAELQNGADAGALGVARSCALNASTCTLANATSTAVGYANANASRLTSNTAGIYQICGSGNLGSCPAGTGTITDCPAAPAAGVNYVDVHTYTQTGGGSHLLPPVFARTLLGNSNYSGSTVYACAQAEWGGPASANSLALTISGCEWDTATHNGTSFAPSPPYPPNPAVSYDQALTLHNYSKSGTSGACPANPADADAPGAFGWTSDKNGTCQVTVASNQYGTGTGVEAGNCAALLQAAWQNRTVLYIPVYSSVTLQGNNTTYTLKGFAAFVVTGFRVPNYSEPDWLNPSLLCGPPTVCVDGVFTQALCTTSCQPGGNNLGVTVVRLTG